LEKVKTPKLLLMGLALSGKTTITKYLVDNRLPDKDDPYHATIDYDRHILLLGTKKITIFDTGGQTTFLDRFTGELAPFMFDGVKAFVFVFDSIDIKEISIAKYYFDLCLKCLAQFSPTARIFIFQHKADLVPMKMRTEVRTTIQEYLLAGIDPVTSKQDIIYYETSVFTYSIIQAIDAVMSWMLDGDLHLYHQYQFRLDNLD
jgi:GTPase SAR1 family protein